MDLCNSKFSNLAIFPTSPHETVLHKRQPIGSHRVTNSNFENSSEKPFPDEMKLVWINGLNASQLQHKEIVQMVKTCRKEIYLGCNRFDGVEIDDLDFDLTE